MTDENQNDTAYATQRTKTLTIIPKSQYMFYKYINDTSTFNIRTLNTAMGYSKRTYHVTLSRVKRIERAGLVHEVHIQSAFGAKTYTRTKTWDTFYAAITTIATFDVNHVTGIPLDKPLDNRNPSDTTHIKE